MKKIFKSKKASVLVEKILMVAFSVAAGGAVIIYGSNVIANAKNTQITGILSDQNNTAIQEALDENGYFLDDSSCQIYLTPEKINGRRLTNVANYINNNDAKANSLFNGSTFTYNSRIFTHNTESMWFVTNSEDDAIAFFYNLYDSECGKVKFGYYHNDDWDYMDFEGNIQFSLNPSSYELIKSYIIADLS